MRDNKERRRGGSPSSALILLSIFLFCLSPGKVGAMLASGDGNFSLCPERSGQKKQEKIEQKSQGKNLEMGRRSEDESSEALPSEKETPGDHGLKWQGSLTLDQRAFLRSPRNYSFKEYRLELGAEAATEKTRFKGNLWVRSLGFPTVAQSSDLFVKEKISPLDVQVREAYVDFYGLIFPWLDLRIGRQRIAWGTADRVNPTDNLDPDDLEDIWDFGRHLGSDAIKATCYLGDFTLSGVFIPTFTPASPPLPDWAAAFMPPLEVEGMKVRQVRDEIVLPARNLGDSSLLGLKMASRLGSYDFSLSYVRGRDDLPLVRDIEVENITTDGLDVLARLIYPRLSILGLDMAGAWGGAGIWAEAAVFFPESVVGSTVLPLPGDGLVQLETVALSGRAYAKFVVGADYTFSSGIYLNSQFAHGFLHERGEGELGDYLLFNVEWRLFQDKLKLKPVAGCLEIREWKQMEDKVAFIWTPSIEYHLSDNAEVVAGVRVIDGGELTSFGRVKNRDEIFGRLKYSF